MMQFGFLRDMNGDKCPRVLSGLIVLFVWLTLCVTIVLYSLAYNIKSPGIIVDVLWSMAGVAGVLLGINAFQKLRGPKSDK